MQLRLLDIARRAAAVYAETGKVAAVQVAGSVARGMADDFSDLELDVYWTRPPTTDDRLGVISALGGGHAKVWPYEPAEAEWAENYRVGAVDVGVSGFLASWMTRTIGEVVDGADPDLLKQLRLAALNDGITLVGRSLVDRWRTQSTRYPDELAVAVAASYLNPGRLGRWSQRRALVARDEVVLLRACIPPVVEMILGALCAVNRVLIAHPAFKWTDRLTDRLSLAPAELRARLWSVANGPASHAVGIVDALLDETIAIVEERLPNVPLDPLRQALAGGRVAAT